jgi:phosphoadenosine phosphosulfate reductase
MTITEAQEAAKISGRELANHKPMRHAVRASGCPFHVDNQCSIYDARPAGCKAYVCDGGDDPFMQHPEFSAFMQPILDSANEPIADVRDFFPELFDSIIARHERIALQFSGGKDSIATLEMMRPYLDRITVYWLNTGDPFPEVVEVVDKVRRSVPNFIEIDGKRDSVIALHGMPSDVIPYSSSLTSHNLRVAETVLLQDRFSCCSRVVMQPMHERMIKDGITLIIRGQRVDELFKGTARSGDVLDGFEFLYPIEDWSTEQVFQYIKQNGWEIPRYYTEGMPHSGDCLVCTAWVGDGRGAYLKKHHADRFEEYRQKISIVAAAAQNAVNNLVAECGICELNN